MACRSHKAFTLTELLVVLGIIVLLMTMLLPVLGSAREAAHAAKCLSNLHQMGLACHGYLNDSKGVFPQPMLDGDLDPTELRRGVLWFNALDYYVMQPRKSYANASQRNYNPFKQDPIYETFGEDTAEVGGNGSRTYKMNHHFGDVDNVTARRVRWTRDPQIRHPSNTVLLFDGTARDLGFSIDSNYNHFFHGDAGSIGLRHGDGANVLFVDGHAGLVVQDTQPHTVGAVVFDRWFSEPDARQTLVWDFRRQ